MMVTFYLTIHSNGIDVAFVGAYTKETLKGTLVHECRTSDDPLCAFRCVQDFPNPKAF